MRGPSKGTSTTIIKRSGRKAAHGVHTGAWKVAFADFTLAMMALFMVLWIMGAISEKDRKTVVAKLNGTSAIDANPFSPITSTMFENGDAIVVGGEIPVELRRMETTKSDTRNNKKNSSGEGPGLLSASNEITLKSDSLSGAVERSKQEMEELARIIMKITSAYDTKANLAMEIVPQGLRILIQDDKDREMFKRGSAHLNSFFEKLLLDIAPVFSNLDNKLIITGHTDATQYHDQAKYNNWNLSGERALAARQMLQKGGVSERQVLQVTGMSDHMPLESDDPKAASNRRIEIMVLTQSAADSLYQFFGNNGEKVVQPVIKKLEGR